MLTVEIELCERDKFTCSPCLLIYDENNNRIPMILPERMEIEEAKILTEKLKLDIEKSYQDLETLSKLLYGE